MKELVLMKPRIIEVIIDGFGYNPDVEIDILKSAFLALSSKGKIEFNDTIYNDIKKIGVNISPETAFIIAFNRNQLNIHFCEKLKSEIENFSPELITWPFQKIGEIQNNHPKLLKEVNDLICNIANEKHYAPWAARTPFIDHLKNLYPSASTKASGVEAGYENLDPEVQGNSETGHQQLGNFVVAPQVPLEIAIEIENGSFYKNPVLNEAIKEAKEKKSNLNVTIMVSGEYGDDGRVHSCWNHLESFLKLLFLHHGFNPDKFRIQAILDGRDAPLKSSLEMEGEKFGFLYKLMGLMKSYHALDSVAWIIGRGYAMDRDYEEERTRLDYKLLTQAEGIEADSYDDAIRIIKNFHQENVFDPFVKPIAIKDKNKKLRKIEPNDIVVDLNFRADRQRARIAALLNAENFLQKEAGKKNKTWNLGWLKKDLNLSVYCITEYHPDLLKYGAKIAYPIKPQPFNFLSILSKYFKNSKRSFKYLLVAESTKAVHMGYFIKGRRESIDEKDVESRFIIPSYAEDHGILTDDDYYKTPQMKAFEVAGKLLNEFALGIYDLAITNFSNPDMLGHLISKHFNEGVRCLEVIDHIIESIVKFALNEGCYIIITSDHGNIEDFSSSHSLNQIITTFISPYQNIRLKKKPGEHIRPFDIPWAITELLGVTSEIKKVIPEIPEWIKQKNLMGEVPIEVLNQRLFSESND
jgi:2,3-bisphosphoglycerate-independent phosphoglycerate mutase